MRKFTAYETSKISIKINLPIDPGNISKIKNLSKFGLSFIETLIRYHHCVTAEMGKIATKFLIIKNS